MPIEHKHKSGTLAQEGYGETTERFGKPDYPVYATVKHPKKWPAWSVPRMPKHFTRDINPYYHWHKYAAKDPIGDYRKLCPGAVESVNASGQLTLTTTTGKLVVYGVKQ